MSNDKRRAQYWIELSDVSGITKKIPAGDIVAARDFLMSGNCHSLALAIHSITNFSLVCFRENPSNLYSTESEPHIRHVAALSPEGWVLDGNGVSALADVTRNKNWSVEVAQNSRHLRRMIELDASEYGRYWLPFEEEKLLPFAASIVSLYYS